MGRELQGQGELPRLVLPVALTSADPTEYSTHSLRRTKTALIYRLMRTKNPRALQLFLGHRKIESTVSYLGVDVDDAQAYLVPARGLGGIEGIIRALKPGIEVVGWAEVRHAEKEAPRQIPGDDRRHWRH